MITFPSHRLLLRALVAGRSADPQAAIRPGGASQKVPEVIMDRLRIVKEAPKAALTRVPGAGDR